jgi:hypothetical protein
VSLAVKLDKLIGATDMQSDMMTNMRLTLYMAINGPVNLKEVKRKIYSQKSELKKKIYQMSILSFVYTYRNLSIATIEKYINFLQTDSAQNFNDAVKTGISDALNNAVNSMAKKLIKLHKKYHKKNEF